MKKQRMTKRNRVLAGIAIFKYVKAVLLIAGGLGAIELLHDGAMTRAEDAIAAIASPFIRSKLAHLLGGAEDLSSGRLKAIGIGALLYAALFIVEGTGLWLEQVWAEYLTVIATASFIPFECWELSRKISVVRVSAFALNIAIVIYLIQQLRTGRRHAKPAS